MSAPEFLALSIRDIFPILEESSGLSYSIIFLMLNNKPWVIFLFCFGVFFAYGISLIFLSVHVDCLSACAVLLFLVCFLCSIQKIHFVFHFKMLLVSITVKFLTGVFRQVTVVQSSFIDQLSPSFLSPVIPERLSIRILRAIRKRNKYIF